MFKVIFKFIFLLPVVLFIFFKDRRESKGQLHIYGVKGYFGLPGKGKTMAMVEELNKLRETYGDKIYIMTNFGYIGQDFVFENWRQLTCSYDKPLVVAWDELQNEFNSRKFKDFPIALVTQLTQVRKGNGIKLYYTSQDFGFVDKTFRRLSGTLCDCNTIMGCYTVVKEYDLRDYEELFNTVEFNKRRKIRPKSVYSFIQTKDLRNSYDSYKMLESAKAKASAGEYMTREEIKIINDL